MFKMTTHLAYEMAASLVGNVQEARFTYLLKTHETFGPKYINLSQGYHFFGCCLGGWMHESISRAICSCLSVHHIQVLGLIVLPSSPITLKSKMP
jgi:hypothetical protein